jgi:lipoate-protein ligase A
METWRLLIDQPARGAANMARDEAIATCAHGGPPPTLRLYRWRPACLSLGRFQRSAEVDRAACARDCVEVVRRPSGGRALLHGCELTYAVIARADHPLLGGASILESYRRISLALLAGLRRLGVAAELRPATSRRGDRVTGRQGDEATENDALTHSPAHPVTHSPAHASAACFDTAAAYELTVAGRKLVGSAQTRWNVGGHAGAGVLLQHGAIPLTPHAGRLAALLRRAPDDLGAKMIALDEALGRTATFDELAQALVAGFTESWGVAFERGELTDQERALEEQLRADKYASDGWTYGR